MHAAPPQLQQLLPLLGPAPAAQGKCLEGAAATTICSAPFEGIPSHLPPSLDQGLHSTHCSCLRRVDNAAHETETDTAVESGGVENESADRTDPTAGLPTC
jgi:hypothetical protein